MNIEFDKVRIELDRWEALILYHAMKRELKRSVESHWAFHKDAYRGNTERERHILRQLGRVAGQDAGFDLREIEALMSNETKGEK